MENIKELKGVTTINKFEKWLINNRFRYHKPEEYMLNGEMVYKITYYNWDCLRVDFEKIGNHRVKINVFKKYIPNTTGGICLGKDMKITDATEVLSLELEKNIKKARVMR